MHAYMCRQYTCVLYTCLGQLIGQRKEALSGVETSNLGKKWEKIGKKVRKQAQIQLQRYVKLTVDRLGGRGVKRGSVKILKKIKISTLVSAPFTCNFTVSRPILRSLRETLLRSSSLRCVLRFPTCWKTQTYVYAQGYFSPRFFTFYACLYDISTLSLRVSTTLGRREEQRGVKWRSGHFA